MTFISKCKHGIYLDGCRECYPLPPIEDIWPSQPKREGSAVAFDIGDMNIEMLSFSKGSNTDYTYVERRVPVDLEDEAHEVIDAWLKSKGYDVEDL